MAESTGRMLAVQLYRMTDDHGMKDMLKFLIARDTMHQNQWLAAWEELGGPDAHPIPTNFPQEDELQDLNYTFCTLGVDDSVPKPEGRWSEGRSFDGKGQFKTERMTARGQVPDLGKASPRSAAQAAQTNGKTTKVVGKR
jgi:Mn-containing catalase